MINDKEGGNCRLFAICKMIMKREALSNIYFPHHFGCTSERIASNAIFFEL
jgi:hypothetical protein